MHLAHFVSEDWDRIRSSLVWKFAASNSFGCLACGGDIWNKALFLLSPCGGLWEVMTTGSDSSRKAAKYEQGRMEVPAVLYQKLLGCGEFASGT